MKTGTECLVRVLPGTAERARGREDGGGEPDGEGKKSVPGTRNSTF